MQSIVVFQLWSIIGKAPTKGAATPDVDFCEITYKPLNGTGLVIANPVAEPRQAYCWQVLDTLEVYSFVDHWGLEGRDIYAEPDLQRSRFGGTIAPVLKIEIDGNATRLLCLV